MARSQSVYSSRPADVDGVPLWMALLPGNLSLRYFSRDWNANLRRLGRFLGQPYELPTSWLSRPDVLYRFGCHEMAARELAKSHCDPWELDGLPLRVQIEAGGNTEAVRSELCAHPDHDELWHRIAIQLMVAEKRAFGKLPDRYLQIVESAKAFLLERNHPSRPARATFFLFNSLNFLLLGDEPFDDTRARIESQIIPMTAGIRHVRQRRHTHGIACYHLSMLARLEGKEDLELENLHNAAELDHGFYDYDYRIAQIFHDRGSQKAGEYYLKALRTSCFDDSLVNDYGCYLTDSDDRVTLSSWSVLSAELSKIPTVSEGATA